MLKRLGILVAATALAGCPDATDDGRRIRAEKGDSSVEAQFTEDFVCGNYRLWRNDSEYSDLPQYLKETAPDVDGHQEEENKREARKNAYIKAHEGAYTTC